jgi:signal transduction histidine kinase
VRVRKQTLGLIATVAAAFVIALTAGWTVFAARIDNYHYDWLFNLYRAPNAPAQSVILAIDEETLNTTGGRRNLRATLEQALETIAPAKPRAVALDFILSNQDDPRRDERLAAAIRNLPNLALASEILPGKGRWEEPIDVFRKVAAAIGHVHADTDKYDGVCRQVPLEEIVGRERRWALSLETYRLWLGGKPILESPDDLEIDGRRIPARRSERRLMLVRYRFQPIERISARQLFDDPSLASHFAGKAVFVGYTALTEVRDRLFTPYSNGVEMAGVEINANTFETLAQGDFLRRVSDTTEVGLCLLLAIGAGAIFYFRSGWQAYTLGGLALVTAHAMPHLFFLKGIVFPFFAPVSCAWLSVVGAASYQYFVVRRQLRSSESERARYREAIHLVTHEMRSPLTAIQGSSELMSRYNLAEDKRKQIVLMINSESKRLARMIQTFLDVERLSAGQMELKREPFTLRDVVQSCVERVRPIGERKRIVIHLERETPDLLLGDRELMEYAVYNLLTNAVKYSPPDTNVWVDTRRDGEQVLLSVKDEGIGMDEKELKNIFRKFYRTERAEKSGEAGTGIGLSIVQQIVTQHGGRIDVTSAPHHGSCFTLALPVHVAAPADAAGVRKS